jgi:hypothetical protein
MATTNFTPGTVVTSSWLNDVDRITYGLADYSALRAYIGTQTRVYITGVLGVAKPQDIAGYFQHDSTDASSTDNGGTILVGSDGRRWKRDFTGSLLVRWFGAKGDGTTDDTSAFEAAFLALISAGGGTLHASTGVYSLRNKITITSTAQQSIRLTGDGRSLTILKFGGAADLGLYFNSTTVAANQLPTFEVEGLGIIASRDNVGNALRFNFASIENINPTVYVADVFIGQDIDNVSESGDGYGYWSQGIYCTNCRNGEIRNLHFYGEMDKAVDTLRGIYLDGECTAFTISSSLILEASIGIEAAGTTEGVLVNTTDVVGVRFGVLHTVVSGAEPQLIVSNSHINAANVGVWTVNSQQSTISNTLIYACGWLDTGPWPTWIGVLFGGTNGKYNKVIGCTFAKESTRVGDETIGINLVLGGNYTIIGNHFFGLPGNPLTYGVQVQSGVTDVNIGADNNFLLVTDPAAFNLGTRSFKQPSIQAGSGVYATGAIVPFPQAFSRAVQSVVACHAGTASVTVTVSSVTTTGFSVHHTAGFPIAVNWIASGDAV